MCLCYKIKSEKDYDIINKYLKEYIEREASRNEDYKIPELYDDGSWLSDKCVSFELERVRNSAMKYLRVDFHSEHINRDPNLEYTEEDISLIQGKVKSLFEMVLRKIGVDFEVE